MESTEPKKRKTRTPIAKAKDKAWTAFSKYIRLRDCILTTGDVYEGDCITCGSRKLFAELQAGHFVEGRGNAVLFDEQLVNAQCYVCNVRLHGNYAAYTLAMLDRYDRETVDEFRSRKHNVVQYKLHDFDRITAYYRDKFDSLFVSV